MSRVTKKAWFGPKATIGWGWRPVSWEGWVATLLLAVLAIAAVNIWHRSTAGIVAVLALLAVFALLAWLTGDPPGGRAR